MLKRILFAGMAFLLPVSAAISAPFPSTASKLPLLSGTYVVTITKMCQDTLTLGYDTKKIDSATVVTGVADTSHSSGTNAGTIEFTQGATAGTGTLALSGYGEAGSNVLIFNSGDNGGRTSGNVLEGSNGSINGSFTQSKTTIRTNDIEGVTTAFQIFYGKTSAGIAQYAAYTGVDSKGCAETYAISHQ